MGNLALIFTSKAIDGIDWMMSKGQFVVSVSMIRQRLLQPFRLHTSFTTQARPKRIDEDHQQIISAHKVG